ncbi:cytochrome P450 [Gautieria morchelliformis]|nr:cytochrome P450 [Gautieria morchelliformis]
MLLYSLWAANWLVLLAVGISGVVMLRWSRSKTPLAPGPRPLPMVGNLFQMPREQEWHTYQAWARKYGDITYLTLLGTPMIILNTLKATRDLMNERSANYSNRPYSAMKELCGVDWTLTNSNGVAHRMRRSIVLRYFSGPAAVKHRSHQQDEARILLANLLKSPDLLELHLKGHAASSILLGAYGFRVDGATDGLVQQMDETFQYGHKISGMTSFLLEKFPALKRYPRWMPFSSFRAYGDLVKRVFADIRAEPYDRAVKTIESGTAAPSFVSTSLDDLAAEPSLSPETQSEKVELIKDCAAVMYGAGTDSSMATMGTFCMVLALRPEVMRRAQAEVDNVTGEERLPTFDDQGSLAYINALFWETLRYNTVTPLGLPHKVVNDDVYEGTFIPGGATIVGNMWCIFRDPAVFAEPEKFKPERFLGDKGRECRDILTTVWGMGRRPCPGRQLAESSLFIAMASVVACFDIAPKPGDTPRELTFTSGFIR